MVYLSINLIIWYPIDRLFSHNIFHVTDPKVYVNTTLQQANEAGSIFIFINNSNCPI